VQTWVNDALGDIESTIGTISGSIFNIESEITKLGGEAVKGAESVGSDILSTAEHYTDTAVAALEQAAASGLNDVKGLVADVAKDVDGVETWATQHIYDPLYSWISKADTWWTQHVNSWWSAIYNSVVAPAINKIEAVAGDELKDAEWIADNGAAILKTLAGAADWLALMAEYSVDDITGLIESSPASITLGMLTSAFQPNQQLIDQVGDWLASLLG
jgi:hypothetical protein